MLGGNWPQILHHLKVSMKAIIAKILKLRRLLRLSIVSGQVFIIIYFATIFQNVQIIVSMYRAINIMAWFIEMGLV